MTLPNFLIIGATKCGTSSLYRYLIQHPDVYLPTNVKEPRFFCYDGKESTLRIPVKTLSEYTKLFDDVKTEKAIGEASPHYMSSPPAAQAIKNLIPDAKLIASLRNPVDRAYSTYLMNLREYGRHKNLSFLAALETDPFLQTDYSLHLKRFYSLFPRHNIKVILFDHIVRDTRQTVETLFEFLDVDPGFSPDVSDVFNPGGLPKSQLLFKILNNKTARRLKGLLPDFLIKRARSLRKANLLPVKLTAEEKAQALLRFKDSILRTQDLIEQDLSGWLDPV